MSTESAASKQILVSPVETATKEPQWQWVNPIAHVFVVFVLAGGWVPPLLWFTLSWLLILGRPTEKGKWRTLWMWASAFGLAGTLLVVRLGPWASARFGLSSLSPAAQTVTSILSFSGASYCLLRSIYAVLDHRRWDFVSYARYWFFAPTFLSGPILKPSDQVRPISDDFRARFEEGGARVLSGLFRITAAVLISRNIPLFSSYTLADATAHWPILLLWVGVFGSGLWLFLNFSGYSEIFIGVARICGVRAPENFDRPLIATDITAFWQRWHISLGDWLRACVYEPLSRTFVRISPQLAVLAGITVPLMTMLICGAWHGITKAFLAWGALHGFGLCAHSIWRQFAVAKLSERLRVHPAYLAVCWLATQGFVALTWVFFLPVNAEIPFAERLHLFAVMIGAAGR